MALQDIIPNRVMWISSDTDAYASIHDLEPNWDDTLGPFEILDPGKFSEGAKYALALMERQVNDRFKAKKHSGVVMTVLVNSDGMPEMTLRVSSAKEMRPLGTGITVDLNDPDSIENAMDELDKKSSFLLEILFNMAAPYYTRTVGYWSPVSNQPVMVSSGLSTTGAKLGVDDIGYGNRVWVPEGLVDNCGVCVSTGNVSAIEDRIPEYYDTAIATHN